MCKKIFNFTFNNFITLNPLNISFPSIYDAHLKVGNHKRTEKEDKTFLMIFNVTLRF